MNPETTNYRQQNIAMAIFTPGMVLLAAILLTVWHYSHSARLALGVCAVIWLAIGPLTFVLAGERNTVVTSKNQGHFTWMMLGGVGTLASIIAVKKTRRKLEVAPTRASSR